MRAPRGIEDRIYWFLNNKPSKRGMCAQHTWHSLGGDYGNPPAWGAPTANSAIAKIIKSKRYWTPDRWDGPPPRGAYVGYHYGINGHACLSLGDWRIATTDPTGKPGGVGVEPITYPNKWGAKGWTLWTDEYNGVRFEVGVPVSNNYDYKYLDKPPGTFQVTGNYKTLDQSSWSPPRSGWEHTQTYLNIDPHFRSGKTAGAIRVRLVREDGDDTGHFDILIHADALDDDGRMLYRWFYWEQGGAGDSSKVQMKAIGGLAGATIYTRYTKKAVVVD